MRTRLTQPRILIPAVIIGVVAIVVAMVAFQPWRLFTNVTVDEAPPGVTPASAAATVAGAAPAPTSPAPASPEFASAAGQAQAAPAASEPPAAAGPVILATGTFISHEHDTAGSVRILELPDGSRVLRLEGLDTSNGPDLKVWLTDAPVIEGNEGWFVFDDGVYLDLGSLKGNKGNQNYAIPADADLSELTSVAIWCDRFSVSFGAAELAAA